ncbi:MAG: hypothetical protein KF799_08700 [Bdellovibrionales bacterium]|nr:hypothetical protein [Bdellovibrionales bacterium]
MNPPNKHIPTLVFLVGAACLLYSVFTFFNFGSPRAGTSKAASAPPHTEKEAERKEVPAPFQPPTPQGGEPAAVSADWLTQQNEYAQKIARGHLQEVGLDLLLPENMQVGETVDGGTKVLLGASGAGKIGMFLFSLKGKYTADKARAYYEDFFKADLKLKPSGKGSPYNSRSGVSMTVYKGNTAKADEYVAYVFKNPRNGQWHVLFLTDRELSRHPAKIRALVDSIKAVRS